jgi:hypothetical protein
MNKLIFKILLLILLISFDEIMSLKKTILTFAYFVFYFWLPLTAFHFFFLLLFSSTKSFHFFFEICLNISATKQPFILCLQSFTPIVVIHKKKRKEREREREREREGEKRRKEIENFAF